MKMRIGCGLLFSIGILLVASVALGQTPSAEVLGPKKVPANGNGAPKKARVIEVGPHSRTWLVREQQVGSAKANHTIQSGRVVEMETGMHFWDGKQWSPSDASFQLVNGTFVADKVQHPVSLAAENINVVGAVKIVTPDGIHLSSTPVAIALMDPVTAEVKLIGTIKDCAGVLVSANQVVYQNAFDGVSADIVYSIDKNSISQDVVLTARINPEDWNFSTNSQIQVISEFYDAPQPEKTRHPLRIEADQRIRSKMASPDFVDSVLSFGELVFGQGKAYTAADTNSDDGVLVAKDFITVEGRKFLIESVEYPAIENAINALPDSAGDNPHAQNATKKLDSKRAYASIAQPASQGVRAQLKPGKKTQKVAALDQGRPGVVIDYNAQIGPGTNIQRLLRGYTYYVHGNFTWQGPFAIEGGTVVKYQTDASLTLNGTVTCETGPYDPAIFTAISDESVGESIASIDPTSYRQAVLANGCANPAINLKYPSSAALNNLRFVYCKLAVRMYGASSTFANTTLTVSDSQIVNCVQGVSISIISGGCGGGGCAAMNLNNALFDNVKSPVLMDSSAPNVGLYGNLTHCTMSRSQAIFSQSCGCGAQLNVKNSIFASTAAWSSVGTYGRSPTFSGSNNGFYNNNAQIGTIGSLPIVTSTANPFEASGDASADKLGGAGAYYLLSGSSFRNAGATAIDPTTLADITKRTTSAPLFKNTIETADVTLSPRNLADADGHPDLGYHYEIIDYMAYLYTIRNAKLTIAPGTTIGTYCQQGIWLAQGAPITCIGTPNAPIRFVDYVRVQEQPLQIGSANGLQVNFCREDSVGMSAQFRFTEFKRSIAGAGQSGSTSIYLQDNFAVDMLDVEDCAFSGGAWANICTPAKTSINFKNNLFEADSLWFSTSGPTSFNNNLAKNNNVYFDIYTAGICTAQNNAFDSSDVEDWEVMVMHDHNAYINSPSDYFTANTANGDVTLSSFSYGTGPLGKYYQVSTGLKDKGSCTADVVGLYHFTTQIDRSEEGNSTVDIGFHYLSTDANGTRSDIYTDPIDTDGDGLPDLYEILSAGTDPNSVDTGNTGIPDGYKSPAGDGISNLQKYQNQTNPNSFSKPPPVATGASYARAGDGTISGVNLTWAPSQASVDHYTVQRCYMSLPWPNCLSSDATPLTIGPWSQIANVASSSTSYFDGAAIPSEMTVFYQVQPVYKNGSTSDWSIATSPKIRTESPVNVIAMRGPGGRIKLVASGDLSQIAGFAVGIWDRGYYGGLDFDLSGYGYYPLGRMGVKRIDSSKFPVTRFVNNVAQLTDDEVPLNGSYGIVVQPINNDGSAYPPIAANYYLEEAFCESPTVFADGTAQMKQNLTFAFMMGSTVPMTVGTIPLSGTICQSYFESHPYVRSDLVSILQGGLNSPDATAYVNDFLPFQWNYAFFNLVCNSSIDTVTDSVYTGEHGWPLGVFTYHQCWFYGMPPTINADYMLQLSQLSQIFNVNQYLQTATRSTKIDPILPTTDNIWRLTGGLILNCDKGDTVFDQNGVLQPNCANIYGLPYISAKRASSVTTPFPEDTVGETPEDPRGTAYLRLASPELSTCDYYFTKAIFDDHLNLLSDVPGMSSFQSTAATPMIIASVGKPIRLLGWAKQKLNNGNKDSGGSPLVYGFLGQYFDTAYLTSVGKQSATTTGVLSDYGEFLPFVPGNVTVDTKADPDQSGSVGHCPVYVISMDVDANRDGRIDSTFTGADKTSAQKPFTFWINNDYDRSLYDLDDNAYYDDSATPDQGSNVQDCECKDSNGKRVIQTQRDLEDFARLWISGFTPDLLAALPSGAKVTLDWNGSGAIDLFQAADYDGGTGYLTGFGSSILQISSSLHPYIGRVQTGQSVQLNASQFSGNWAGNHFVWCGVSRGSGWLNLKVSDSNGNVLAQSSVYITLKDIKEMYERWTVGDAALSKPLKAALPAVEDLPSGVGAFQYDLPADQNTPYILYVHGWNMDRYDKDRFAETAFKRLYWQGYKGRFGVFRWPTDYGFVGDLLHWDNPLTDPHNFDNSENTAWNSAAGLLNKLKDLNKNYPGHVYLLAHSMGNVVAGEALRLGASQSTGTIVNTYVATQGAIPAHVYDSTCNNLIDYTHTNPKIPNAFRRASWGYDTPNIYGDRLLKTADAVGRRINYYNVNDFALSEDAWCFNQEWKPDLFIGGSYGYAGSVNDPSPWNHFWFQGSFGKNLDIVNNLQDLYEAMAFAAESRSKALGATPGVNNMTRDQDLSKLWNPDPSNNNYRAHFWHSAQFRGACWEEWNYWNTLLYSDRGFIMTK